MEPQNPEYILTSKKEDAQEGPIDQYPFGCSYQPKAHFKAWFVPQEGFHVSLTCYEVDPVAVYKNHNDPVYKDSCLEFFANFYPEDTTGYLNFEMNSKGALLAYYGHDKYERFSVLEDMSIMPEVRVEEDSWTVDLLVPLTLIHKHYGKSTFEPGQVFTANAYKCGDETASKHYGSWSPIVFERPNFHRPECFGTMRIK